MTIKYLILTEEIHKELKALAEVVAHIETGLVTMKRPARMTRVTLSILLP